MEFSRKMLLVPADKEKELELSHLSELDQSMHDILKQRLPEDSKAKLYLQILQKFVSFPNLKQEMTKEETLPNNEDVIEQIIRDSAPMKMKNLSNKVLNFLKFHKNVLSWSPSRELIVKGTVVPNSDIVTLVNHVIRQQKDKPIGFDLFYNILKELSFPPDFVKNKYLKTLYAKPVKRLQRNAKNVKWLKY